MNEEKISKEVLREEEAQKILNSMNESNDLSQLEENLKDNKMEFEYNGDIYRVRMLTQVEKDELHFLRVKKFSQLLQDKDILLEKDLIIVYKERGIDILEIDSKMKKLEVEKDSLKLKLGEAIANKEGEAILKTYKEQISELRDNIYLLTIQKSNLLTYSLENQLANYVAKILTYLSLYKKVRDDWGRVFKNLEEFEKCNDEILLQKAACRAMLLQYII